MKACEIKNLLSVGFSTCCSWIFYFVFSIYSVLIIFFGWKQIGNMQSISTCLQNPLEKKFANYFTIYINHHIFFLYSILDQTNQRLIYYNEIIVVILVNPTNYPPSINSLLFVNISLPVSLTTWNLVNIYHPRQHFNISKVNKFTLIIKIELLFKPWLHII